MQITRLRYTLAPSARRRGVSSVMPAETRSRARRRLSVVVVSVYGAAFENQRMGQLWANGTLSRCRRRRGWEGEEGVAIARTGRLREGSRGDCGNPRDASRLFTAVTWRPAKSRRLFVFLVAKSPAFQCRSFGSIPELIRLQTAREVSRFVMTSGARVLYLIHFLVPTILI